MPAGEEAADTLATLQNRLKQLEDQLLQLNAVGQPKATGAGASSNGTQPTSGFRFSEKKDLASMEVPGMTGSWRTG